METRKVRHARLTPGRVTLASGALVLASAYMPWVLDGIGWDYFRLSTSPAKLLFDLPKTEGIGLFFTGLVAALSGVLTILLGAALLRRELRPTVPSRSLASLLYGGSALVAAAFPIVNVMNVLTRALGARDVCDIACRFGSIRYGLWIWLLAALVAMMAVLAGVRGQSPSR